MMRSARRSLSRQYSLGAQELTDQRSRAGVRHVDEHDRQVAGDTAAPQIRLAEDVLRHVVGTRARRIGAEDA